jgi:uncharacterized membrane protein
MTQLNQNTKNVILTVACGAISGIRSMAGPAAVANSVLYPRAVWVVRALALSEMAADKLPSMPARTEPLPLGGRIVLGGVSAALAVPYSSRRGKVAFGLLGAVTAWASSWVFYRLRSSAIDANKNLGTVAALAEDAIAVSGSLWVANTLSTQAPARISNAEDVAMLRAS